ncbi:hypothetical protein ACFV1F_20370 [Streptomyces sp. NPDC059590]|uniref:hypothetical protein n=1 Tax=Streptomyces sp. NPDC059590 TaxID=3346877 RepID=UPI0036A791B0
MTAMTSSRDESPLLQYREPTTDPAPPQIGKNGSITFEVTNTSDGPVPCEKISVDLQPPDVDSSQYFTENTDDALTHITQAPPRKSKWTAHKHGSVIDIVPKAGSYLFPRTEYNGDGTAKNSLTFTIDHITVSESGTDAVVKISEATAISSGSEYLTRGKEFAIKKCDAGTVFENFRPYHPDQILVGRGTSVRLVWDVNVPHYSAGEQKSPAPYYITTLGYDQLGDTPVDVVDVTGAAEYPTRPLSHSTIFTLTLSLYKASSELERSYSLRRLIAVAPSDANFATLNISGHASLLRTASPTGQGRFIATTDGFLHCRVQAAPDGSPSGLSIKLGSADESSARSYNIISTKPSGSNSSNDPGCAASILLPVAHGSYTDVYRPSTADKGTYQVDWHPLGAGVLIPVT